MILLVRLFYYGIAALALFLANAVFQSNIETLPRYSVASVFVMVAGLCVWQAKPALHQLYERFSWATLITVLFLFSGVINVLALTGSFYMMQIYDRVLPSRSVGTLLVLSCVAGFLYISQGYLDILRSKVLTRVGNIINDKFQEQVYYSIIGGKDGSTAVRDVDTVRAFMGSSGPGTLFDLPWIPVYLFVIFAFHTYLGVAVLVGGCILLGLAYVTDIITTPSLKQANKQYSERNQIIESCQRNREVLKAMGLYNVFKDRWVEANNNYLETNQTISDRLNKTSNISKIFRAVLQSGMLGLGAYLVLKDQASGGVIIAASILSARALAPIDMAIANWKNLGTTKQAWIRLNELADSHKENLIQLPAPKKSLMVDKVTVKAPNSVNTIINDVSFSLRSGQAVGIVGESGSGKSTLARTVVGAWEATEGAVRLDGADLKQWGHTLSKNVGYLPQDVELFAGTIAQNICRFDPNATDEDVINAAMAADCHDMIVKFENGYLTMVGENGNNLSAGQRQRIGLARALYGNPFIVVLDEPNANLDAQGEQSLSRAIMGIRQRQGIAVVITHRRSVLAVCDMLAVMESGSMAMFGFRNQILKKEREQMYAKAV